MKKLLLIGCMLVLSVFGFSGCGETKHKITMFVDEKVTIKEVDEGMTIRSIPIPEKTGYVFDGWYYDKEFSLLADYDQTITKDLIIYSKWKAKMLQVSAVAGAGYTIVPIDDWSVAFGDSFSFRLVVAEGFDVDDMVVKANNKVVVDTDGVYTIGNVTSNIVISVHNVVSRNMYTITLPSERVGYAIDCLNDLAVYEGEDFSFRVTMLEGYTNKDVVVRANNEVIENIDGKYTIHNVSQNMHIAIYGVKPISFDIVLDCDDHDILPATYLTKNYGESYSFVLNCLEKYNFDHLVVTCNGEELVAVDGVYTIENIKSDMYIVVGGYTYNEYTITFEESTLYTITGISNSYHYGDIATFYIALHDAYDLNKLVVKYNDEMIEPTNGAYHVEVKSNGVIEISSIVKKVLTITAISGEGYVITPDSSTVEYGDDLDFMVEIVDGYDATSYTIMINDTPYDYTTRSISNITENIKISIVDLKKKNCKITLVPCSGITFKTLPNVVEYGSTIEIDFEVHEDYDTSKAYFVINGKNYAFTTTNIKIIEDITISVVGLALKQYMVAITTMEGCIVDKEGGYVDIHSNFELTLTTAIGYTDTARKVYINGELYTVDDNVIIIENITEDISIVIEGMEVAVYAIELVACEGVEVVGLPITIKYTDTCAFTITIEEGYIATNLAVTSNKGTITKTNDGYVLSNVADHVTITIVGAVKQKFNVTIIQGNNETLYENVVEYGESYTLTITPSVGYTIEKVVVNGSEIHLTDGRHTISNVTSDIVVVIYEVLQSTNNTVTTLEGYQFVITGLDITDDTFYDYFVIDNGVLQVADEGLYDMYTILVDSQDLESMEYYELYGMENIEIEIQFLEK